MEYGKSLDLQGKKLVEFAREREAKDERQREREHIREMADLEVQREREAREQKLEAVCSHHMLNNFSSPGFPLSMNISTTLASL